MFYSLFTDYGSRISSLCLCSTRSSTLFIKLDRHRVDTMPNVLLGQPLSPESVSLMRTAVWTKNFFSSGTEWSVDFGTECTGNRIEECWPYETRIEGGGRERRRRRKKKKGRKGNGWVNENERVVKRGERTSASRVELLIGSVQRSVATSAVVGTLLTK